MKFLQKHAFKVKETLKVCLARTSEQRIQTFQSFIEKTLLCLLKDSYLEIGYTIYTYII